MLKVLPPDSNFHNFKCGEIFCISSSSFKVACCLCGNHVELFNFPQHFLDNHLMNSVGNEERTLEPDPIKSETDDEDEELLLLHEVDEEVSDDEDFTLLESSRTVSEKKADREDISAHITKDEQEVELNYLQLRPLAIVDKFIHTDAYDATNDEDDIDWNEDCSSTDVSTDDEKSQQDEALRFPCTKCTRSYKSKAALKNHNHAAHNAQNKPRSRPKQEHKCDECGEYFRSERNLRGHMWKHTGIFCDICGKPFTQTGNMLRHKIRHTGIKAHKCQECSACFYTDKELRAHMLRHTGIWPHICEICGRRCRDRGVLTAHMRRHTGERPATCNVCGKSFYSFHDLNVHAVAHTTARPFVCDICGSSFQRKKALRVHKKLHSTERKHECQICGKSFVQPSYLNAHMRTHDAALSKNISVNGSNVPNGRPVPPLAVGNVTDDTVSFAQQQLNL